MCKEDDLCERFFLKCDLEALANGHTVTDQNGNQFVSLNRVQAILRKLECKEDE